MDGVVAGSQQQSVGSARSGDDDRTGQARVSGSRVVRDALHAGDVDAVTDGLIAGRGQVDGGDRSGGAEDQRVVGACATVDAGLAAGVGDGIVARAADESVGSTVADDGIVAGAAEQVVRSCAARNLGSLGRRQRRAVDVGEAGDDGCVRRRLIRGGGEVDRGRRLQDQGIDPGPAVDRGLGAPIGHGVVTGTGRDRVLAPVAVDRIVAGSREDDVVAGSSLDRQILCENAGVDALEVRNDRGISAGLIGTGGDRQVDARQSRLRLQDQCVVEPGSTVDRGLAAITVDRVVAGPRVDGVRAALAVDRIGAGAAVERVGSGRTEDIEVADGVERASVDVGEVCDDRRVAGGLVGRRIQIDEGGTLHHQCVVAGAAVDRPF